MRWAFCFILSLCLFPQIKISVLAVLKIKILFSNLCFKYFQQKNNTEASLGRMGKTTAKSESRRPKCPLNDLFTCFGDMNTESRLFSVASSKICPFLTSAACLFNICLSQLTGGKRVLGFHVMGLLTAG